MLEGLNSEVEAVYFDREFYDTYCLKLLSAHNYGTSCRSSSRAERSRPNCVRLEVLLSTTPSKAKSTVTRVPLISRSTSTHIPAKKEYDKKGVARHGYAVGAAFIETPRQARKYYSRRFGVNSSIVCSNEALRIRRHRIRRCGFCTC